MTAPEPGTTEPATTCPVCARPVGTPHPTYCAILAEVIGDPSRPGDRTIVQPSDLETTGCGCIRVLVDHRGPRNGHRGNCPRREWVTSTTRPTHVDRNATITIDQIPENIGGWTACWVDDNAVSRHGIRLPDWAGAYATQAGFPTWDAAANFLDGLAAHHTGSRPLGVFCAVSVLLMPS